MLVLFSSLGLACAPTVRFAAKRKVQGDDSKTSALSNKNAVVKKGKKEDSESDSDDSDDNSCDSDESETQTQKDSKPTKLGFNIDDDEDDELFVKKKTSVLHEEKLSPVSSHVDELSYNNKVYSGFFY